MSNQFNNLKENSFVFKLLRIPETEFRIIGTVIPAISVPPAKAAYIAVDQYFPGSNIIFSEYSIKFIVDENLANYEELYRWIIQQQFVTPIIPGEKELLLVSDGVLTTLNNSSVANRIFYFKDLFPIYLGNIIMDTTTAELPTVTCEATFRYSYFELREKSNV